MMKGMCVIMKLKLAVVTILMLTVVCTIMFPLRIFASGETLLSSLSLDCVSAILMEAETGTVLYEQNADQALPPASVTKIMTLLLTMEALESGEIKLDDMLVCSANAAAMGGSQVYLEEGEQMSVEDLIKCVVICSANDAAVVLSEAIAGSEEEFVSQMNQRAKELGMTNTAFENTNGLDDTAVNHVSSARDIAIMSRELIKHDKILQYSSLWMDSIRNGEFGLTNTNRLVRFYPGATGLKTGSTSKAKFCISATAKRNGMHLICVIMGADTRDIRNSSATRLLDWGFANYSLYQDLMSLTNNQISVSGGVDDRVTIAAQKFCCVIPKGAENKIVKSLNVPVNLSAPILENASIGSVRYNLEDKFLGETPIVTLSAVDKIEFKQVLFRIFLSFMI